MKKKFNSTSNQSQSGVDVEKLLERSDSIKSEVVKEALDDLAKVKREADKKKIINVLGFAGKQVGDSVITLRRIRKSEKDAKANLQRAADAEAALLKDGDVVNYFNILYPGDGNNKYIRQDYLLSFGFQEEY